MFPLIGLFTRPLPLFYFLGLYHTQSAVGSAGHYDLTAFAKSCTPYLPEIAATLGEPDLFFGTSQGWEKQTDQDCDDGDDHQQFDQRECDGLTICNWQLTPVHFQGLYQIQ